MRFRIKHGLDIPVAGEPEQRIHDAKPVTRVALVGTGYHTRKRLPTLLVQEGDRVKLGQRLARGEALAAGVVERVNQGERRRPGTTF